MARHRALEGCLVCGRVRGQGAGLGIKCQSLEMTPVPPLAGHSGPDKHAKPGGS